MSDDREDSPGANEASHEAEPAEPATGQGESDVDEPPETEDEHEFFVVGIGASAGGLEAVGELLRYVPADSGMAFIVVQHLAPDHESVLAQLLARGTPMKVATATDGMPLQPNRVHVIAPNADLAVLHGVVRIMPRPAARGPHLSVDYLFRSLAEDQGQSAIGIVLSGTGTDGTLGLAAIKAAGGFTFVQEPSTARYDGMPRSALQSGAADYCLRPKEIGEELTRIASRRPARPEARVPQPAPDVRDLLGKLFVLIRSEFGTDLSQYKQTTIDRRVERRMMLHRLERLEDYVRYVQQDRAELQALYKDILIAVTSFFRDPEAFEALETKILAPLLERKKPGEPIRVWVPACATGEEAYSIAMCLAELSDERVRDDQIQIFGTDVDDDSIQHARRGVYPGNIALDVSPERLHRFFVEKEGEHQISRRIRDMLVFSRHDVLKDAPFSHIDLVSCRNFLIYLQPSAQKKVLRTLHYALEPSGHLLLGTSETVGDAPNLFSPVDRKHKIYAKRSVATAGARDLVMGWGASIDTPRAPVPTRPAVSVQDLADRKVLELYGPPGAVVSETLEILQFRGRTGPYLDPTPGAASLDILRVARPELHIELERALHRARAEQVRVTTEIAYHDDGRPSRVEIDVVPLHHPDTRMRCLLVLFHSLPPAAEIPVVPPELGQADEALLPLTRRIQELERDLAVTREYLQATTEEKDSTLEELKSANEQLQASNEELQSTNEELETSREEMQSTNEELTTVNEELHNRMAELSQTNDDLHNVLTGVDNAVVIVGMDLQVRRYTTAAERLFHLVPGDIGRSVGVLDRFLGIGAIEPKVSSVIQELTTLQEEILASNQRWYALKVSPYKTQEHAIRGALVTLVDIDVRRRAIDITRDVLAYVAKFLGAIEHPLLILDAKLRVVWANGPFLSTFQLSSEETVGSLLESLGAGQLADPGLRERLQEVFTSASLVRGHELRLRSPAGGERTVRVGAGMIPASGEVPLALVSIEPTPRVASGGEP